MNLVPARAAITAASAAIAAASVAARAAARAAECTTAAVASAATARQAVRALAYRYKIRYACAGRRAAMAIGDLQEVGTTVGSDDELRLRAWKRRFDDGIT